MMPPDVASRVLFVYTENLGLEIEQVEHHNQRMCARLRQRMGALRAALFSMGFTHDALPEMPFLDPAHLEAWKRHKEELRCQCQEEHTSVGGQS